MKIKAMENFKMKSQLMWSTHKIMEDRPEDNKRSAHNIIEDQPTWSYQ